MNHAKPKTHQIKARLFLACCAAYWLGTGSSRPIIAYKNKSSYFYALSQDSGAAKLFPR
jgi:hypothetical protein